MYTRNFLSTLKVAALEGGDVQDSGLYTIGIEIFRTLKVEEIILDLLVKQIMKRMPELLMILEYCISKKAGINLYLQILIIMQ